MACVSSQGIKILLPPNVSLEKLFTMSPVCFVHHVPGQHPLLAQGGGVASSTLRASLSPLRSPLADMPCPLPRRSEPLQVPVASRFVRPSLYLRRAGVGDFPFEACSGLLRVMACRLPRPAVSGLCHEVSRQITQPRRLPASMLTDNYIGGLRLPTGVPAPKRRTEKGGLGVCPTEKTRK